MEKPKPVLVRDAQAEGSTEPDDRLSRLEEELETARAENRALQRKLTEHLETSLAAQSRRIYLLESQMGSAQHRLSRSAQRLLELENRKSFSTIGRSARSTLARRRFRLELVPGKQVHEDGDGWQSTGEDPSFELKPRSGRYPCSWVRVFIELSANVRWENPPLIYADGGDGFTEIDMHVLPVPKDGVIETLIKLPPQVRSMRFDPVDRPAKFKIGRLEMQEMGKLEVGLRGLGKFSGKLLFAPGERRELLVKTARSVRSRGLRGFAEELRELARGPQGRSYLDWVSAFDVLNANDRHAIASRIDSLERKMLFSIVMPVYETPRKWLKRAIESVQAQLYPNWELCIADDASKSPHVRAVLEEYAAKDPRIKVVFREKNGHISESSNSALELATGDFTVLFDHDDELTPHALYWLAEELAAHPETDLVYSDEDKVSEDDRRYDPYFKNEWDPELFASMNYFSHLGAYRTSLLREVGGFRKGYEGSQDYDLALRCIERTSRVRHIPAILYHWRAIAGSTAVNVGEKSYAQKAAERALSDHFERVEPGATISAGAFPTTYRVHHPLPAKPPLTSILIPTRDSLDVLKRAVDSILLKSTYPNYEILIVDNESRDPATLQYFATLKEARSARIVPYAAPFNYSAINNLAAKEAAGSVLVLLNNDVEVISEGWLEELVSQAIRPGVGAVGARLLYPNGSVQHAGVVTGIYGVAGHIHRFLPRNAPGYFGRAHVTHSASVVTGACLAVQKSIYEQVGGLDEKNLAVAFNDVDFCLRLIEAGYRNIYTPYAELYHFESYSRGADDAPEKKARFEREIAYMHKRWDSRLKRDPAYNPNLSLRSETFELAWPPRVKKPWVTD